MGGKYPCLRLHWDMRERPCQRRGPEGSLYGLVRKCGSTRVHSLAITTSRNSSKSSLRRQGSETQSIFKTGDLGVNNYLVFWSI